MNPLLERVVQSLERFFGAPTLRDLPLRGLKEAGVVDGGRGLAGDADQKLLVLVDETLPARRARRTVRQSPLPTAT